MSLRSVLILLGLVVLASTFLSYVNLYNVRPTVFSANGWSKRVEFNVPASGYYQFDVPVLPGMQPGGKDIVLVDANGNVLEYYAWSGFSIPYSRVYEVNYLISSEVFKYVPYFFQAEGGAGIFDENLSPVLGLRKGESVMPFYRFDRYYVGVGGAESPYMIPAGSEYQPDWNSIYFVTSPNYVKVIRYGREYMAQPVLYDGDNYFYIFGYYGTASSDPWSLIRCSVDLQSCSIITSGSYFPDIMWPVLGWYENGRVYILTGGNPYEMYWYCSPSSRQNPNSFGCFNGVRLGYFDQSGQFHPVWYDYLWEPQYLWFTSDGLVVDGKLYVWTVVDNWYGPDSDWGERPFFYLAVYDVRTGEVYAKKKYYYDQFIDIVEPYPRRKNLVTSGIVSGDNFYLFVRYLSVSGVYKSVILVFDRNTLEFKYRMNTSVIFSPISVVRGSDSFDIRRYVYISREFDPGYALILESNGDMYVIGLHNNKTHASNPALIPVYLGDKLTFVYTSFNIRTQYYSGDDYAAGYVSPDFRFHDVLTGSGCCMFVSAWPYELGDKVLVFGGRRVRPSVYGDEYPGYLYVLDIRGTDLAPASAPVYDVSVSISPVSPQTEDVVHVRAYFPAPGTYYLYYGSDSSWYHTYPQATDYESISLTFSEPEDVHIRPHSYNITVYGDGTEYNVYVEFNDEDGPVYSQCFWNGVVMHQLSPGYHVLTVPGRSPVEYSLDCFALEVAELHKSGVMAFPEVGDLPADLNISPSEVERGGTVTLTYTGENPVCYAIRGDSYVELNYPTFVADFPAGDYNILCDSPGYEPAYVSLTVTEKVQIPSPGAFVSPTKTPEPEVTGAEPIEEKPVQPASPLPVSANVLAILLVLLIIFLITRRR